MQRRNGRGRSLWMILACVLLAVSLLAAFGAAGAFASLGDTTSVVKLKLEPAKVDCRVNDEYTVTNTGSIPALVRAKLVVNWVDAEGNILMYPPEGASYQLVPGAGWTHDGKAEDPTDGFWYCDSILQAKQMSAKLIGSLTKHGEGELKVEILAEAIQATPAEAAKEAWGMNYANGSWSK